MSDDTPTGRMSWLTVVLVGVPLHVGLIVLYVNVERIVFPRPNATGTYLALIGVALVTTFVAGKLGRIHGGASWLGAGLLVGVAPYAVLIGLFWLVFSLTAGPY